MSDLVIILPTFTLCNLTPIPYLVSTMLSTETPTAFLCLYQSHSGLDMRKELAAGRRKREAKEKAAADKAAEAAKKSVVVGDLD